MATFFKVTLGAILPPPAAFSCAPLLSAACLPLESKAFRTLWVAWWRVIEALLMIDTSYLSDHVDKLSHLKMLIIS